MVATQTQFRRGTNTQVNSMVPAVGEVVVDTTNDRLCVGDGTRDGGFEVPNFIDIQTQAFTRGTTGGTANAITLTLSVPIVSYAPNIKLGFIPEVTNTGPVTINVDGKGDKDLLKYDGSGLGDLESGDLIPGIYYEIFYDGTQFQMASSGSGLTAVSQGDLNTLEGSVSCTGDVSGSSAVSGNFSLPGGSYGFYPETRGEQLAGATPTLSAQIFSGPVSARSSKIYMRATSGLNRGRITAYQRYITSSPPYDLGEGEVSGFIFALVNALGDISATYAADTPPWAYNGPTDIRCTHKCKATGKKFRKIAKKKTFEQIMDGARTEYILDEITQNIKNSDMGLIPHPFGEIPEGHSVVLIDPMDEKIRRMMEYQNSGGDLNEQIYSGRFTIDNDKIKRKGPKGVPIHKMKYKFSGKK